MCQCRLPNVSTKNYRCGVFPRWSLEKTSLSLDELLPAACRVTQELRLARQIEMVRKAAVAAWTQRHQVLRFVSTAQRGEMDVMYVIGQQ